MKNNYFEFRYSRKRGYALLVFAFFSLLFVFLAFFLYWKGDTETIIVLMLGIGSAYAFYFSIKKAKRLLNEKEPLLIFDENAIKLLNEKNYYNEIFWHNIKGIEFNQSKREDIVSVETSATLKIRHKDTYGVIKEFTIALNEFDSKSDFIYSLVKSKLETGNFIIPSSIKNR